MAQGPTMRVAELVTGTRLSDLPDEAIRVAKDCLLDTVGVTVAGRTAPAGQILTEFVRRMGGAPDSSVFGAGFRTSPWAAALANGNNAATLDYDDNTFLAQSHLSGSLVTTALALAEARRLGGTVVLEAYIVGFEAACSIGAGVLPGQYFGGRHSTGTLGVMGATAAAAKLLRLDARKTAVAFGIAASAAGAVRGNFGSMTKGFHTGHAASNGILAASLASEGFTARPDILETKYGYAWTTVKDDSHHLDRVGEGWGAPWKIVDPGMGIKFQPSGTMSHCAGQCARELAVLHHIRPEEVTAIVCRTTPISMDIGSYGVPADAYQAMYSTPWAIAVALADRKSGLAQFSAERVKDPAVLALAGKVEMTVHPDFTRVADLHDVPAAEVVVTLKDGRSFSRFQRRPRGYPGGEPWTDSMLDEKFRETAGLALPQDSVERALTLLRRIDQLANLDELTATLRGPSS